MDRETTKDWLMKYHLLSSRSFAEQWVASMNKDRTIIINYGYGQQLVRGYIERRAGNDPVARWDALRELFSRTILTSDLE